MLLNDEGGGLDPPCCASSYVEETLYLESEEDGHQQWTVDEEMAEHVQSFVDEVHRRAVGGMVFPEVFVSLKGVTERFDIDGMEGGTVDALIYHAEERLLEVVDLKYGTGVVVEVENNTQLLMYALGAALEIMTRNKQIAS